MEIPWVMVPYSSAYTEDDDACKEICIGNYNFIDGFDRGCVQASRDPKTGQCDMFQARSDSPVPSPRHRAAIAQRQVTPEVTGQMIQVFPYSTNFCPIYSFENTSDLESCKSRCDGNHECIRVKWEETGICNLFKDCSSNRIFTIAIRKITDQLKPSAGISSSAPVSLPGVGKAFFTAIPNKLVSFSQVQFTADADSCVNNCIALADRGCIVATRDAYSGTCSLQKIDSSSASELYPTAVLSRNKEGKPEFKQQDGTKYAIAPMAEVHCTLERFETNEYRKCERHCLDSEKCVGFQISINGNWCMTRRQCPRNWNPTFVVMAVTRGKEQNMPPEGWTHY
jgi:hypothetical protein